MSKKYSFRPPALLLALSLMLTGNGIPALAETASTASDSREVVRISGNTRYETSVAISQAAFDQADTVVLTSGVTFPDALAGSPFARTVDAPILLVETDRIPADVLSEIQRLGATKIVILGGEAAVSKSAEAMLSGYDIQRIAGLNRYQTAIQIGDEVIARNGSRSAVLVNGINYPDALSISPVAALQGSPVLLTGPDQIASETSEALKRWGIEQITIVGGTSAVSGEIEDQLLKVGYTVDRIHGSNRNETALAVAANCFSKPDTAIAVNNSNFPDALSGGPLAASLNAPVLLVNKDTLDSSVPEYLSSNAIRKVIILGGTGAVSETVANGLRNEPLPEVPSSSATLIKGRITSQVNFRTAPTTDSTILTKLVAGTTVNVLAKYTNKWYQVEYDGTTGYVSSSYLSVEGNSLPVGHLTASASLYSSPDYSGDVLQTMPGGAMISILEETNPAWTRISYQGQEGYITNIYWADLSLNVPVLSKLDPTDISSESLLVMDVTDNKLILNLNSGKAILPASLTKLFTVQYALSMAAPDELVNVEQAELDLISTDGSSADLIPGTYTVQNLIEAMLVPSGNDAAYALAKYIGMKQTGPGFSAAEYVEFFLSSLRTYLAEKDYSVTRPTDPSGDAALDLSTTWEIYRVTGDLMQEAWFRNIVSQEYYTATFPDGSTMTWRNSNRFLRPTSEYYDPAVIGVKTGTFDALNNLASAFQWNGKEYIIVSLGSQVYDGRYLDGKLIMDQINLQ